MRFSGKKRANRERLTRLSSTSVSPKSVFTVSAGACQSIRWTLDEPILTTGSNTAYLTLELAPPDGSGLAFSPDIHTWYQTQWQDVAEVQVCASANAAANSGFTGMTSTQTNAEYYVGFVPQLSISVA